MKRLSAFVIIAAMAATVSAQWTKDGKPLRDNSWRQQKNGFRVALLLVDDPPEFERRWKAREPIDFSGAQTIRRNAPADILFVFNGCPEGENGLCDVLADFRVLKPDQTVAMDQRDQPFWVGKRSPAPSGIVRATSGFTITMDDAAPSGQWTVQADVRDRVSGIRFRLQRHFRVGE